MDLGPTRDKVGISMISPTIKRWFETLSARPAVEKGCSIGIEFRQNTADDKDAQKVLFGQTAQ